MSDVVFSCFSLYPFQHLHFCCVHPVLPTFSYRPTFLTICHCGSNCCFVDLVIQYIWEFLVAYDTDPFALLHRHVDVSCSLVVT